jgi:hypothetical protein
MDGQRSFDDDRKLDGPIDLGKDRCGATVRRPSTTIRFGKRL